MPDLINGQEEEIEMDNKVHSGIQLRNRKYNTVTVTETHKVKINE